ncbi:unnamed protein product [Trifolium pratense]|uniref:Uncharacterized protein n=1 Tax=Trifolium pratense TaxID=57577 RepID=A0ACB0JCN0_TRIPR|nr:unnamed protein product [Trifolium pratense]
MLLRCGITCDLSSHRNCGPMRLQCLPHPQYCGRIRCLFGNNPCNIKIVRRLRETRRLFGNGLALIASKPSFGWLHIGASLLIFEEVDGVVEYLLLARVVGMKTRLSFMCFVTAFRQLRDWIFNNIYRKEVGTSIYRWQTTIMTTCWYLWKWRNKTIFDADFRRPNNPTVLIQRFIKDVEYSTMKSLHIGPKLKDTIYIGWKRPGEGWVKLNSDGACKNKGEVAGCGGLFRDSDGRWIKGYTKKIEACDALQAEMWGLYLGLDMAWREQFSHLIVENDSKILIDMISDDFKRDDL